MLLEREPIPELSILNQRPKVLEGPRLLHQLIQRSPATFAPAIDFLEDGSQRRTLTYDELHASSDALANKITLALQGLDVTSEIIPVLLPQSVELYITLLAILKAGKAFCPIGPDTPKERLHYILKDVQANLFITNSAQKENVAPLSSLQVLFVDQMPSGLGDSIRAESPHLKPSRLAYVLYTSGSTGLPKAVSVSHFAVTQSLLAHDRHIPHFSRFLQFAAPTFDVSIFEIFFPLYRGCTLVGCTRGQTLNDLPGIMNSLQVDAAELTPTVVSNLLRGRSSVPRLKLLLTIGEMLTSNVVNEYGGDGSRESILWGMYGPTEAAIHCTLQPHFQRDSSVGNIGFPLDTVSAFVAAPASGNNESSSLNVLPVGEIGELVVGGPQVADEYLNRPELTASAFLNDPNFGYLYRTGDKVRLHHDGTLECLGRIVSGQIKLRGQRVELGEVEQIIFKVDGCLAVTVMVIEETLVAFCAVASRNTTAATILDMCNSWLPPHMVPTDVVLVDRMPQLASGKTDQKSLRAQYLENHYVGENHVPTPNGDPSSYLTAIIQKSLGRTTYRGKVADIAGIDSLGSIRVASALREQGYSITPIDVLSAQDLATLIHMCEKRGTTQKSNTPHDLVMSVDDFSALQEVRQDIEDVLPCTALQEAMLAETSTRPSAYCNWIEVELLQPMELSQIRRYLQTLARHNEIIRSGFLEAPSAAGSFVQVVWKTLPQSTIQEVANFSRSYSLGSADSLLHPLLVQVLCSPGKTRLLFQIHHALYDGWSFDILLHDLQDLISDRTLNPRPPFREVVRHYMALRESEAISIDKEYWASILNDYSPIRLPNYNGKIINSKGLRCIRGTSCVDAKLLYSRAKDLSVNPQVFFQTATAYMFSLYSGSDDVVIGTVTSGRTIPVTHVEDIMGPCIASLPFRLSVIEQATVKDLLRKSQQANRDMLHHCTLPLRDIAKICGIRPGEHLFDVLFVWQQSLITNNSDGLGLRVVDSADDLEYKITLEFEPRDDTIGYRMNYDPSIIPEQQVRYLSEQIDQVVNYFLSNENGQVEDIAKGFDIDTISLANPYPKQTPIEHGLSHAVERWASETPDQEAVILGYINDGTMCIKDKLTYASLNMQANQLAHALLERGVGEDKLVGIILEKSTTLYASILAVLKIGCGYLPITPDTPLERIKTILSDAEVAITISEAPVSDQLQDIGLTSLNLSELDVSSYPVHNPDVPYVGSHLAYAIFTSGSTGKPKGVLVTQDNLMSNLEYLSTLYPTSTTSRLLQSCSQAFDVSVFEIFFSWHVGMCLCTAVKDDLFYDFEAAINNLEITHLSLTPTVASLVDPDHVPKVQFLVTAGEALTESVKRKWAGRGIFQGKAFSFCGMYFSHFLTGYGPSETTNICTIRPNVTSDDIISNIGKSFPNTSTLILEPGKDTFVPRGAIGELCFGGSQVFRGYLNRPDLNAEKLIDHPLYGRIYRSGDMGILLPDDSITFTGRIDDQVKIRGQRVELGEITSIMLDHSAVKDCATVLLKDIRNTQSLVCFWVPQKSTITDFKALAPADLRSITIELFETLSLRVPSYMVPSHLVPITKIPMTAQAKIDKRLLRTTYDSLSSDWLEHAASTQDTEDEAQQLTPSEQLIVENIAHTLSIDPSEIRRTSSFFNLGIDSISAIGLAKGLRDSGLGQVHVSTILKNPSVKRLAAVLASNTEQQPSTEDGTIDVSNVFSAEWLDQIKSEYHSRGEEVETVLPCTPLQEAMLSSTTPSSTSYVNTLILKINGNMDQLLKYWSLMFERHQILRTAFLATDNAQYAFSQVVLTKHEVKFEDIEANVDLKSVFQDSIRDRLEQNLPPVKIGVQDVEATKLLVFSCHHALYDGTAITTLLGEIQDMLKSTELPPPVPYERYLKHMINLDFVAADRFWLDCLRGFEPTSFPNISSKFKKPDVHAESTGKVLQTSLSEALRFSQSSSISLLSLLQTSWAKILHFCLGESDVCFGNVVSGRTLPEEDLDRLVAPCFNTIPIRINLDTQHSNSDLCRSLHAFNIDASPFELTPLRRIQSKILKNQGRLFDALFILQQPSRPLDEKIWSLEQDVGEMDLPIVCEVFQDKAQDTLKLVLHHNTSLMQNADANVIAENFDIALATLLKFPEASVKDTVGFPSHSLSQSNMNVQTPSSLTGQLIHSEFERNAAEQPDSIALDFLHGDGNRTTLSFAALNDWANQIAQALLDQGVKTEDIIPLHMFKSPQFYASILGVLKSGAAFAPVHPDLPVERKRFMLSELRPKLVLLHDDMLDWAEGITGLDVNKVQSFPKTNPIVEDLRPTNLAYCLYTSGSTGLPKAVSMEHRAPIQTINSSKDPIPWNRESKLLQYAAITFDMCYYDCFLAWTFGFTLCAAEQGTMLNDLAATINTLGTDLLDLTPSVAASLRRTQVPGVKWLYCIGEAMTADIITEWHDACVNSYGPTEAAFCTTIFPASKDIKSSIIGKPFPSTSFAVFPTNGERPVPIFGVGELYIGGTQLARGYLRNAELSEEKFVHKCGQRFYRSGDMARMLGDGNFEFLGRADDQVKIRGLRVELGEINHVLQDCDQRITAVTTQILKKDASSKSQLVAFLKTAPSLTIEEQPELRRLAKKAASAHLPSYMVPQFFIFIDEIPKSMAGKIDKKVLNQIFQDSEEMRDGTHEGGSDASAHKWTKTESLIREIFSKLSNSSLEDVLPSTTIYQIGLDSISAVQVAAALRKNEFRINATDVLRYTTCKDLAAFLETNSESSEKEVELFNFTAFETSHKEHITNTLSIRADEIEAIRPCTPLQSGMLSHFISKNGSIYFNYLRLRIGGHIDLQRMRDAWATAMRRHPLLRTGFAHTKNGKIPFAMVQYKENARDLPWDGNQSHFSVEEWRTETQKEAAKQLHQPPWRLRLIETDGQKYLDLALLHAIFDAHSLQLIFDEVAAAYNDTLSGEVAPLEPVLGHILQSGVADTANVEFWKQLGKSTAPTRFPNLTPLRYEPKPAEVARKYSSKALEELELGCRKSNTTLQVAAMVSWAALLAAYTGEKSVTFGVVLSGRNVDGADNVVLPCITTVPFACDTSKDRNEIMEHAMKLNAGLQQHQFTPLNEIIRSMGFSNEQLFDSIFAFQKLANAGKSHDLWTVVDEKASTEYPLSIELEPVNGKLEYRLTYLPHIIPTEQASLILDQLDSLLKHHIFGDATDASSRDSLLYSITPAKEPVLPSRVRLLHEFVEMTAAEYPDRTALEFATSLSNGKYNSQRWTYAQLDAEGNRIAHLLISHNVKPGDLVAVCFEKCPEASIAMLGILKAGAAFVALDPGAPTARKSFIVQDSGAKALLTMSAQSSEIEKSVDIPVVNLDGTDPHSQPSTKPSLEREIEVLDRSYCLYTSGTTGTPKGCELTHENAVQALLAFQRLFAGHWNEESRWLQFASFHFDVSVLEQYWSWSVGICVVSAPRDLIFEDLPTSISALGITHIDLTPSLARILHPDDVPSLCKGVFITGGESLKQEILDTWGPKGVIYNGYGPTEATIGVTMYPRVPANGKPSNIGPQFDNVGSYVLHPGSDVPVLRGGVGELCVSGKLVGKGYLNRPDLTQKAFPTLQGFNERVYRTGDLVRILHNGTFDFLGRADDQVKLRGQRLEIGEINTVIKQSDAEVADVATLVLKHPKQQKEQLVAFVVVGWHNRGAPQIALRKSKEINAAKQLCQDKLPPYMVPTHFVTLNAMPLNVNNKADGKKLKEMYNNLSASDLQALSLASHDDDREWSEQEDKIRSVLKDTLEIERESVTRDASFFELGMDSISVIRVVRALKDAGFAKATASTTMTNSTVRRLAKALSKDVSSNDDRGSIIAAEQAIAAVQHRHRRGVAKNLSVSPDDIEAIAPCTPLQQGMIARTWDSGNGLYFNEFRFSLAEHIDLARLRVAWQNVVVSTQILRTVFINTDDGFLQAVMKKSTLHLEEIALANDEEIEERLAQRKREWAQRNQSHIMNPFELLVVKSATQSILVVHIFHALYDGISIELVFRDVWNAYNERPIEKGPPFTSALAYGPLRTSPGAKEFWMNHLREVKSSPLPTITNASESSDKTPVSSLSVTIENLQNLEATRRKLNVTAQAIAQSCWNVVLCHYLNSAITLGTIVSGRSIEFEGADHVNGPMFNTIPYHYRPQRSETWASIIQRTHDFNVAAHAYQHTPLRDILKWCKRSPSQPLFEVLFVYQAGETDDEWKKNDFWELLDGDTVADYPIAIEVDKENDTALKLTLVAQGEVCSQNLAQQLLDQYEEALRQATNEPDVTIDLEAAVGGEDIDYDKPHENGNTPDSSDSVNGFEWTDKAVALRKEIASLAETELSDIDEKTSVFELGLDSIDAIKLSSRLKKQGIQLPVSGVMRSLNIANMLQNMVSDKEPNNNDSADETLQSRRKILEDYVRKEDLAQNIETVLPLTPLQEAMVAEMIESDYRRYFNHDVLKLASDADIEKLQNAWKKVASESPILRTSFVSVNDPDIESSFAQVVYQKPRDFVKTTAVDTEPDFASIMEEQHKNTTQHAGHTPLFHLLILQAPEQTYLVLSIAHALYDGWSLGLLHRDVQRAYNGEFEPRPNYEAALSEILESSGSDAVAFWTDYLSDASPCTFPRNINPLPNASPKVYRKQISSTVSLHDATEFTKNNNITLQTLGQTVHALTVASYTGSMDVTFGAVLSGRDNDERAELMFPVMNTVIIRCILHGTRREMLRYVQQNFSNIRQYQHFPLRKALSLAGLQGSPLESLFIYQKSMGNDSDDSKLYESLEGRSEVEFAVCVEMEVVNEQLVWRCAVREDVLDEAGAQGLLERLDEVMRKTIDQPHVAVTEFADGRTRICGVPAYKDGSNSLLSESQNVGTDTQMERTSDSPIAKAIREVLASVSKTPVEDITEDTTIFHIGLDSISAIKVSSLLRKQGIILSVSEMLKSGTVKKMANVVDAHSPASEPTKDTDQIIKGALATVDQSAVLKTLGCSKDDIESWLPATAGQVYMLSMWLNSNGTMFYPEFTYKVRGLIDFTALDQAWRSLTEKNPMLRTRFHATGNEKVPYIQLVLRETQTRFEDVTGWNDKQVGHFVKEQSLKQPLVLPLASRSSDGWDLRLKIHHALYDGVSLPILMQNFQDSCNRAEVLPVSTNVLTDFAALSSDPSVLQSRKSFWTRYLEGVRQQHLPRATSETRSKCEIFKPNLSSKINAFESLARTNNVTTQSLFLAVFARLYASMTHTPPDSDIIIGIYLANRSLPSIPNLSESPIPAVNLVPLRVHRPLETSPLGAAARIQRDLHEIGNVENVGVALWEISEWIGVQVDCWVNFLRLPDADSSSRRDSSSGDVSVEQVVTWNKEIGRVVHVQREDGNVGQGFEAPSELVAERIQKSYMVSVKYICFVENQG